VTLIARRKFLTGLIAAPLVVSYQNIMPVKLFVPDVQGLRSIFVYRVVCDETNNTPEVIDSNEFVFDIYRDIYRLSEKLSDQNMKAKWLASWQQLQRMTVSISKVDTKF
jgi:hypothetical protein